MADRIQSGKEYTDFCGIGAKERERFSTSFFNDGQGAAGSELPASYLRLACLYDLLQRKKSIVFGGSRTNCESIATAINKLNSVKKRSIPVKIRTHHSSVGKFYREEAEAKIRARNDLEGGIDSIISTSTLELGIDIGEPDRIFQLNAISGSGSFLQRVGRTGRRPGKPQYFRGLLLEEDELVLLTGVVSLGLKGVSESLFFPRKSFHILAHQLICLCLQSYGIARKTAWDILSCSYCFSQITENQFHELVGYMVSNGFLRDVDGELVTGDQAEKYYLEANYQELFAVFSTGPLYEVFNEKNHVGNLDCAFVESIIAFISDLKHKSTERTGLFLRKLDENNSPVFFSKFGKCLPDHLTATTLAERSYNFQGLIDELNKNQIEIFST